MLRHLTPRIDFGRWGGGALSWSGDQQDDVQGFCICIQWLGLMIEIGMGRVR